jgi:hypothetical protein
MNERLRILQRQPRRISITLSFHVHEELLKRSEEEGRSMSNLCAFLLEDALRYSNGAIPAAMGIGTMHLNNHVNSKLRPRPRSPF